MVDPISLLSNKLAGLLVDLILEPLQTVARAGIEKWWAKKALRKAIETSLQNLQKRHPQWMAVLVPLKACWDQPMARLLSRVLNPAEPDPDPSELAALWRQALARTKPSPTPLSPPLDLVAKDFLEAFQKALYDQPLLQEILKQRTYRHLDEHLEALTHALGKAPARPTTLRAYLHWVISQHAHVDTRGMAEMTAPPVRLPLDRVFVPLRVSPGMRLQSDRPLDEEIRRLEAQLRRHGLGEKDIRLQIEAHLARYDGLFADDVRRTAGLPVLRVLRQHDRIVLLGEPGIGKTTLLRYLALQHARALMDGRKMAGPQGQLGPTRFPIYLRIADYIQTPEWPTQPLSEILPLILRRYELTVAGLADLLREKLERGEALILLDGLDEIPSVDERIRVVQRIDNFVQQYVLRGNRFVITSRIVGYRQAPLSHEYAHFVLREMNDDQMRTFVRRWVHAYEDATAPDDPPEARKARAQAEAQRLLQAIARNPGVRRLASNPFMLQILALIHRSQALLPQRRVHLYKIAARTLIEHWNVVRGLPPEARLNPQQVERVLAHLAFWLHQERPGGLAARQEVHQRITQALQQEGEGNGTGASAAFHLRNLAEDFLRRVREQTGLFVERAPGYFGFDHLAFEEYFAARYLVRLLLDTRSAQREEGLRFLRTHLHDPNWREPILLALGYIDQEGLLPVDDLVRTAILAQGEEAQRLGFQPSPYEDLLGQDYLFALQCLADDIHLPTLRKPLLGQLLQEWVYHKGRGRFRAYRAALARRLVAMQGTAVGMELARTFAHLARNNTHAQARQAALEGLEHLRATHLLRERRKAPQQPAETTPTEILLLAGTAEGVTALVQALETATDPLARKALIQILGESGSRQALPHLIQALLRDHDWRVRTAAAWALGRIGTPLAVSPLVQVLKRDADERVQTMALWALGRIGSLRGMNALVNALRHASPRIRRAAAVALGTMAVPQALTFLARALEGDEDPRVREAAAESLGHIGSREALDVLRRALEDPEPGVRRAAAWALGRVGAPSAAEPLLRLLESDDDWRVRAAAAWSLGRIGEHRATDALVRHLTQDEAVAVREAAAESLGRLGVAVGTLIQVLHQDPDWRVRRAAALALGYHSKAPRALPALIQTLLRDDSMAVRRTATESISRLMTYLKDELPWETLAQKMVMHLKEQLHTPRADDLHAALWALMVRE